MGKRSNLERKTSMTGNLHEPDPQRRDQNFTPASLVETFREIGVVVHDENGRISQVNSCFCRMFGYKPEEVLGRELDYLVARDEELVDALALSELYCKSGRGFSVEVTRYRKDGTPFQALLSAMPMFADTSAKQKVNLCTYIDLTDKREQERELRRTLTLFENLFARTPTPVVLCDNESRVIRANASLYRLFGYTPEEMEGRIIDYLIAHGPCLEEAREISSILFSGIPHQRRTVRFRKDGSPVDVAITAIPFATHDGEKLLFGIYTDISPEKEAERKIEAYEAELRYLALQIALSEERERRRIAEVLHDEIGFELASLYQTLIAQDSSQQQPHPAVESLKKVIAHIRSLTREISNPALYAAGLDVGIRSLLDQLFSPCGIRWKLALSGTRRDLPQEQMIVIYQMVRELLRNVLKHAHARTVSVRIRYRRHSIGILVKDDGIGSQFFDGQIRITPGGWGLFGIRERLKHIGGRLIFRSQPGKGTRCTLWIPTSEVIPNGNPDLHR
jgi:PAS domain S-box-containing protein